MIISNSLQLKYTIEESARFRFPESNPIFRGEAEENRLARCEVENCWFPQLYTCFTIPMQTIIKIKAMLLIISNFYLKMNNYDLFKITPTFYPQIDRYCKVFWIRVYWIIYKCNWRRCIIMLNFLNFVSFLANYTPITWDVSANNRHIPLHAGTFHWFFIIIL